MRLLKMPLMAREDDPRLYTAAALHAEARAIALFLAAVKQVQEACPRVRPSTAAVTERTLAAWRGELVKRTEEAQLLRRLAKGRGEQEDA